MTPELKAVIEQRYPTRLYKELDEQCRPYFLVNTKAAAIAVLERLRKVPDVEVEEWDEGEQTTRSIQMILWQPSPEKVAHFRRMPPSEQERIILEQGGTYWFNLSLHISNVGSFYQYSLLGYRLLGSSCGAGEEIHTPASPNNRLEIVQRVNSAPTPFWNNIVDTFEGALISHNKRLLSDAESSAAVPWIALKGSLLEETKSGPPTVFDCFFGYS